MFFGFKVHWPLTVFMIAVVSRQDYTAYNIVIGIADTYEMLPALIIFDKAQHVFTKRYCLFVK